MLALAILGWLVAAGLAVWLWRLYGWRPLWRMTPDQWPAADASKKACLVDAQGLLHSVRTVTGPPPAQIVCRAGTYVLDTRATGAHYTYRRS